MEKVKGNIENKNDDKEYIKQHDNDNAWDAVDHTLPATDKGC